MSQDETAVNQPVVEQDTTPTESAPVENDSPEVTDDDFTAGFNGTDESTDESETKSTKETAPDDSEDDDPQEEAQSRDDKQTSPEDEWNNLNGKSQDKFRQAINERNELRRQMDELQAKQAQLATEQDLINEINPETGDYYTPQEIERISWQQARQAQAEQTNRQMYETQVRQNQLAINDEASRVQQEFSLLNPQSKDFDQTIASQYAEMLNESLIYAMPDGQTYSRSSLLANGVNPDEQATLVNYTTSPYKLAKVIANSVQGARAKGETLGQANAQRATEKMLATADVSASASQATPASQRDPFAEGFDSVS